MIKSNVAKFLISGASLITLSSTLAGCGLANLPGGYSPIEQQTVQDLNTSNYTPRSADERAAILTQDLFAQAAFWSREYDLNPADLEAAVNLASALRRLGNPRKSIEVAQTTRALYPRDIDLMAELAAAHLADNNPKDALPIIDTALGQRPNIARLWSLKGAALDQFEQFTEARQQYSRALSIAPNDPGVIANVGLSYALEGDPKTAEIWLRRAANMPGASANVRQNLSLVLGLQNKFDEAEKWAGRDLDEQSTANNMSYIRTLRGSSTPVVNTEKPIGTPVGSPAYGATRPAPQAYTPNPYTPKTYGAPKAYGQANTTAPRSASIRQTPTASYQRPAAAPQTSAQQRARQPMPATRLNMTNDLSNYEGGPKTSRDAALAVARQSLNYGTAKPQPGTPQMRMQSPSTQQTQSQRNVAPQDVLGRISQNNIPKTAIAQRQQQQLAYRAQMQAQQRAGQPTPPQAYPGATQPQMPYSTPAPYPNMAAPNSGYPQHAYSQPTYATNTGQVPPAGQDRQPARQRRR